MDGEFATCKEVFYDNRSIQIGLGRIIWGPETTVEGVLYPEGWVLPGGRRTQSGAIARQAAEYINRITRIAPAPLRAFSKIPASRPR